MLDHTTVTDRQLFVATEKLRRRMTDPAVDLSIRHRKRDGKLYLNVKATIKQTPICPKYLPFSYDIYTKWIAELFPLARATSGCGSSLKIDQTFRIGSSPPRVKKHSKRMQDDGAKVRLHTLVITALTDTIDLDLLDQWLSEDAIHLDQMAAAVTQAITSRYKLVAKRN